MLWTLLSGKLLICVSLRFFPRVLCRVFFSLFFHWKYIPVFSFCLTFSVFMKLGETSPALERVSLEHSQQLWQEKHISSEHELCLPQGELEGGGAGAQPGASVASPLPRGHHCPLGVGAGFLLGMTAGSASVWGVARAWGSRAAFLCGFHFLPHMCTLLEAGWAWGQRGLCHSSKLPHPQQHYFG